MDIVVNKKNLEVLNESEERYKNLKQRLKSSFQQEIYYKMEVIKILKEIKDNEYYKLDGYRTFEDFIKDYHLARSQAYDYLKIANAIQEGILEEVYVIENGVSKAIAVLRESPSGLKKSKQNSIKPLRFQLKTKESYDFYKSNVKFTGFMMHEIFENQKDLINKLLKKYKQLKG
ncbi:chromosome replication/partitioning protein [Borreliella valaisiana]|uniref:Putative plasmid partition protein n=2 Tax=Borreliella TaxID=64895 RepID=C0R8C8_BORVA|nr:chromosome replication/partitioning protein [Borreliella valaisiana]ACN52701.1 putative plasmid partition protein [Borreliella valaisiana VS116]